MSDDLERLTRILVPVMRADTPRASWSEAAARLGIEFSGSYQSLLDTYGQGAIGGELLLVDPRRSTYAAWLDANRTVCPEDNPPLSIFPGLEPCLLPIGANGNADALFLVVDGGVASDRTVWMGNIKNRDWLERHGPLARVLADLLTGTALDLEPIHEVFGSFAWTLHPTFEPFLK